MEIRSVNLFDHADRGRCLKIEIVAILGSSFKVAIARIMVVFMILISHSTRHKWIFHIMYGFHLHLDYSTLAARQK
jgi:hypothetical protein